MGTWILILTLVSSDGNAIHSIEFSGKADCEAAKVLWLTDTKTVGFVRSNAICVKT